MPVISFFFLHQPLPGLGSVSLTGVIEWFLEGLRIIAPARVQEARWRALFEFVPAKDRSDVAHRLCIERSWLGLRRFAPMSGSGPMAPLAIELPDAEVLRADMDLPAVARRSMREAISHRLDEFSPLPADEVMFAVGTVKPCGADRIAATIAIARKSTINELTRTHDGSRVGLIGASPNSSGKFDYVFFEQARRPSLDRKSVSRWAALLAGALLLAWGVDTHLDRKMAAARAQEAAYLEVLQAEHQRTRFLNSLPPAPPEEIAPKNIDAALGEFSALLPDGVWVEQIALAPTSISASGYVRRNADWPQGATPSLTPSDRTEIDRFTLKVERSADR